MKCTCFIAVLVCLYYTCSTVLVFTWQVCLYNTCSTVIFIISGLKCLYLPDKCACVITCQVCSACIIPVLCSCWIPVLFTWQVCLYNACSTVVFIIPALVCLYLPDKCACIIPVQLCLFDTCSSVLVFYLTSVLV